MPNDLIFVAMGTNLKGNFASTPALLEAALARMEAVGLRTRLRSSWWRSPSWPDPSLPDYLNGVVIIETPLEPRAVLETLLKIENEFGRRRGVVNAPRTLDLDLIAYGRSVMKAPDLILPHPRAAERLFVMGPLAEIAPDWVHPTLNRTAAQLAMEAGIGKGAHPI